MPLLLRLKPVLTLLVGDAHRVASRGREVSFRVAWPVPPVSSCESGPRVTAAAAQALAWVPSPQVRGSEARFMPGPRTDREGRVCDLFPKRDEEAKAGEWEGDGGRFGLGVLPSGLWNGREKLPSVNASGHSVQPQWL